MNTDGNMAALDRYMREQEKADMAYDDIIGMYKSDLAEIDGEIKALLDKLSATMTSIATELDECGFASDKDDVLEFIGNTTDEAEINAFAKYVQEEY